MKIFEKQIWHLLVLSILLFGVNLLADDKALSGSFWGLSGKSWFWLTIGAAIAHQLYVWLFWRLELHYDLLRKFTGENPFLYFAAGFALLIAARPLSIVGLAIASRNTFSISPFIAFLTASIAAILGVYLLYSVKKYFGFQRAFGIDHFDSSYKNKPFVKDGIFKWSDNAMYKFGFLLLWIPGLICFSKAALIAAFFSHIYIWVHYYFTELPDIKRIYGR
ncbi:MAG: methyltransferase [bacterium]